MGVGEGVRFIVSLSTYDKGERRRFRETEFRDPLWGEREKECWSRGEEDECVGFEKIFWMILSGGWKIFVPRG